MKVIAQKQETIAGLRVIDERLRRVYPRLAGHDCGPARRRRARRSATSSMRIGELVQGFSKASGRSGARSRDARRSAAGGCARFRKGSPQSRPTAAPALAGRAAILTGRAERDGRADKRARRPQGRDRRLQRPRREASGEPAGCCSARSRASTRSLPRRTGRSPARTASRSWARWPRASRTRSATPSAASSSTPVSSPARRPATRRSRSGRAEDHGATRDLGADGRRDTRLHAAAEAADQARRSRRGR